VAVQHNTTLTWLELNNNTIGAEIISAISNTLARNVDLFPYQYWLPCLHVGFPQSCHKIIMATLLCNRSMGNFPALPDHVWYLIFSFWQRKNL
jgi:hypothetical protein